MSGQYDPTPEQRKAIEAYVNGSLLPLLGTVLTKQLGMAAVFLRDLRKYASDLAPSLEEASKLLQHSDKGTTRRHYRSEVERIKPVR